MQISNLHCQGNWTNGPIDLGLDLTATYAPQPKFPLAARLTAERTLDAQERWEHLQKQMGD